MRRCNNNELKLETGVHPGLAMGTLFQDCSYALRTLRKDAGFTLVAVVTLALGIGANTTIFSVLNAVVLKPLPFDQPERLMWGWGKSRLGDQAGIAAPDFVEYRDRNRTFDQLSVIPIVDSPSNLVGDARVEQVTTAMVSANFFNTLGIRPMLGRSFTAADEKVTLPQVVILGHSYWQQRFGGDARIVGTTLALDGESVTVAGVLASDIPIMSSAQVWIPTPMLAPGMTGHSHFLRLVGRLKPGVTQQQAQADLDSIAHELGEKYPATNTDWSVRLEPLADVKVGPVRSGLWILLGAVGLVLLIACSNVANLLLARGVSRQTEIAIRTALGAKRGRIIRQLLTESFLLAGAGGLAAILLASWAVDAVRRFGPAQFPRMNEVHLDARVLAFAAFVWLLTSVMFGLAPALQLTFSDDLQGSLKDGTRGSGTRNQWLGSLLVVSEVTLSLVLMVSAGLLVKSFWRLVHVNPGFHTDHLVTTQLQLPQKTYADPKRRVDFLQHLLEGAAALPGVESAAAVSELPLSDQPNDRLFRVQGREYLPNQTDDANYRKVEGDYLRTMGIPLLRGRSFGAQDSATSPRVVLVNEPFVKHFFPHGDAIGKRLLYGRDASVLLEIVGVVGGVRHDELQTAPRPEVYVPNVQEPALFMNVVVRTAGDPARAASALRAAVAEADADIPISAVRTMNDLLSSSLAQPRFSMLLLALFALIALVLAAVGLYGVISYTVSQRTREIGIRMALGADPRDILRLVVGHGLRMTALGIVIGLAAALGVTRLLGSLLFEVGPFDAGSFAGLPLFLAFIALVASWIPARRAARVDPLVSLRNE
jgi:putative ABC transport system permease protein